MRSLADRIRHTILFEIFALIFASLLGSWVTGHSVADIGVLAIFMSILAMSWNLTFNWMFDLWYVANRGTQERTILMRIIHACLFEFGMLLFGLFIVMWWLNMGFIEALLLDIGFAIFFLIYAFVYNWVYDVIFPIPEPEKAQ